MQEGSSPRVTDGEHRIRLGALLPQGFNTGCAANERASEPTRTERAGEAARERACRGVRGATPLGETRKVFP